MSRKIGKKKYIEKNVWEETLDRWRTIYDYFDEVVVSFSGGKDSTAVLNSALVVARERNALPLKAIFCDEEAIHPTTIEYVRRVSENPEIDLQWYCLEFKHRNACSNSEPFWYTWEKEKKEKWVAPMPPEGITEHPTFKKGMTFQEWCPTLFPRDGARTAICTGIRTQESLRRYRIIASKTVEPYINYTPHEGTNAYFCQPIYDWSSEDVWLAVHKFGWDYNKTYDIFNQTRFHGNFLGQRVCPPYGEEPLRGLWVYSECFPEMWHKMLERVDGVSTAWRYANTHLYSNGNVKPEGMTYREYANVVLDSYGEPYKSQVKRQINKNIKSHRAKTDDPISDETPHPITGMCWKHFCSIATRGDFKDRQRSKVENIAEQTRNKLGITLKQAISRYGKKRQRN